MKEVDGDDRDEPHAGLETDRERDPSRTATLIGRFGVFLAVIGLVLAVSGVIVAAVGLDAPGIVAMTVGLALAVVAMGLAALYEASARDLGDLGS